MSKIVRVRPRTRGDAPERRHAVLTDREVEVLRLAAQGLTTREIAERLFISAETTDHHIQHVYTKIGVSTRAAAALWGDAARCDRLTAAVRR